MRSTYKRDSPADMDTLGVYPSLSLQERDTSRVCVGLGVDSVPSPVWMPRARAEEIEARVTVRREKYFMVMAVKDEIKRKNGQRL